MRRLAVGAKGICASTALHEYCWGEAGSAVQSILKCEQVTRAETLVECQLHRDIRFQLSASAELGLASPADIRKVVSGPEHACVLAHRSVICFGPTWSSLRGERNANRSSSEPNRVAVDDVSDVVALGRTTCALARGDVYCWGDGLHMPPGAVASPGVKLLSASFPSPDFGCFLGAEGSVWCGADGDYQLIPELAGAKQIVAIEGDEVCARLDAGAVHCISRGGEVKARPNLSPAAQLIDALPCALLFDGSVHCDSWRFERHTLPGLNPQGLGIARGIGATSLGGRPAACAISERGGVACWGITGFDWSRDRGMAWMTDDRPQLRPSPLRGAKNVVQISPRGGCLRTKDGQLLVLGPGGGSPTTRVRLAAERVQTASRVMSVEEDCVVRSEDGSAFTAVPDWPFGEGPAAVGSPRLRGLSREELATLGRRAPLKLGKHLGYRCQLREDVGVACVPVDQDHPTGPEFDPLLRSTLPLRVFPLH
ncbi:MAG: hypothetical protein R3B13_27630 [Polyangiaceae bacterium]